MIILGIDPGYAVPPGLVSADSVWGNYHAAGSKISGKAEYDL